LQNISNMAASTAAGLIFLKDEKDAAGFAMTGGVTPAQFKDVMGSGDKFVSYVCLLPTFTADNCPRDAITEAGLKFAHLPFEVSISHVQDTAPNDREHT
jgi:hypothetical protein